MQIDPVYGPVPAADRVRPDDAGLRAVALELEAAFLSEMLKHAGLDGAVSGPGGGGAGEAQFASLLRDEQARLFAESGGVGLAESIVRALAAREDARGSAANATRAP